MLRIILWGAGKNAESFLKMIDIRFKKVIVIVGVTSNDSSINGGDIIRLDNSDLYFYKPSDIENICFDYCVVCSSAYKDIYRQIEKLDIIELRKVIDVESAWPIFLKEKFLDGYKSSYIVPDNSIIDFIKKNGVCMYPYDWYKELPDLINEVYEDDGMKYVVYKGKRCYYPHSFSTKQIIDSANFFVKEQYIKSPHCYIPDDLWVINGGIIVDCGSAEANFTLDVIDKVDKAYIIEGDEQWIPALEKTFRDYMDKVVIVNKYLDSYKHEGYETIDSIVKEDDISFIKMDIEGFELKALYGAKEHIKKNTDLRMSICTYHNHEDYEIIKCYLESLGMSCKPGEGFLFRMDDSIWTSDVPDLRKGILYAKR